MVNVDLTPKEIDDLVALLSGATVPMAMAEAALATLKKFKEAQ